MTKGLDWHKFSCFQGLIIELSKLSDSILTSAYFERPNWNLSANLFDDRINKVMTYALSPCKILTWAYLEMWLSSIPPKIASF